MGVVLHGREMLAFNGQQHRKPLGDGVGGQGQAKTLRKREPGGKERETMGSRDCGMSD